MGLRGDTGRPAKQVESDPVGVHPVSTAKLPADVFPDS